MTPASVFGGSHRPPDSNSKVVQTLGPSSFIVKTTEVVSAPRSPGLDLERLMSDITISADPGPAPRATSPSPAELPKSVQTKNWLSSIPNSTRPLSPQLRESRLRLGPLPPIPGHKNPSTPRTPRIPVMLSPDSVFQNENPDSWKPPDAWDCSPAPKPAKALTSMDAMLKARTEEHTRKSASFSLDLVSMQREMKMMEAATPQTILTRLKEQWDNSTDPAVYQETVMEKQRWMLSAMYNVDRPGIDGSKGESAMVPGIRHKNMKILALFESQCEFFHTRAWDLPMATLRTDKVLTVAHSYGIVSSRRACRFLHIPHVADPDFERSLSECPPDNPSDCVAYFLVDGP